MSRYYSGAGRPPPSIAGLISVKVDNIGYDVQPDELKHLFDKFGDIGDVHIPRDGRTGESRGYRFVRFYSRRDAEEAIYRLHDTTFNGRRIGVCNAQYDRPSAVDHAAGGRGRDSGSGRDRRRTPPRRPRSYSRSRSRSRSRSPRKRTKSRSRSDSRSKSRSPKPRRRRSRSHS